jgi:hypothetical protein
MDRAEMLRNALQLKNRQSVLPEGTFLKAPDSMASGRRALSARLGASFRHLPELSKSGKLQKCDFGNDRCGRRWIKESVKAEASQVDRTTTVAAMRSRSMSSSRASSARSSSSRASGKNAASPCGASRCAACQPVIRWKQRLRPQGSTAMRDRLARSAEDTAQETAERWVIAFDAASARGDARAWAELLVPDSHRRNLFGPSWLCLLAGAHLQPLHRAADRRDRGMGGWRSALKREIREARWNSLKSMAPACATR